MGKLIDWLVERRRELQEHFDAKKRDCEPNSDWWIIVYALQKVMKLCNRYMVELQGKQLLVGQQKAVLERLRERLTEIGNVQHTAVGALVNARRSEGFRRGQGHHKSCGDRQLHLFGCY